MLPQIMLPPQTINWQNRFDALQPCALVAFDHAATRLARKLLSFEDCRLASLEGVATENLIFLAGKTDDLPWIDGVIYLGKDLAAPALLLPTNLRPSIPVDLFERALLLHARFSAQPPFAVVENKIISIGSSRFIARAILNDWLDKKI